MDEKAELVNESPFIQCRTCLVSTGNMTPLSEGVVLYEHEISLSELIMQCASVQISPEDSLPDTICEECVRSAYNSYSFKQRCEESQKILLQLSNIQTKVEPSVTAEENDSSLSESLEPVDRPVDPSSNENSSTSTTNFKERFKCKDCQEQCSSIIELDDHMANVHKKIRRKKTKPPSVVLPTVSLELIKEEVVKVAQRVLPPKQPHYEYCSYCGLLLSEDDSDHIKSHLIFQCSLCDTNFGNFTNYEEHLLTHEEYKCTRCNEEFTGLKEARSHVDNHTVKELFPSHWSSCKDCKLTFKTSQQLIIHYTSKHRLICCKFCKYKFKTLAHLLKHMSEHMIKCNMCDKVLDSKLDLKRHMRMHNYNPLKCRHCEYIGANVQALAHHRYTEHDYLKTVACKICKRGFFSLERLRVHHRRIHTGGVQSIICDICGRTFRGKASLDLHIRTHTGEKPYKCEICGGRYAQGSSLKSHMIMHTDLDEKNYTCTICGMSFRRKGTLRMHTLRHNPEKKVPCTMCPKTFKCKESMKRHRMTHEGSKNYICDVCNKGFTRNSSLTVHRKIHTGEKPHACTVCDKRFLQAHVLRSHMNTHRPK